MKCLVMYEEYTKVLEVNEQMSFDEFREYLKKTFNINELTQVNIQCFNEEWNEYIDTTDVPDKKARLRIRTIAVAKDSLPQPPQANEQETPTESITESG